MRTPAHRGMQLDRPPATRLSRTTMISDQIQLDAGANALMSAAFAETAASFPVLACETCHPLWDLYTMPACEVGYEHVKAFVLSAEEADLFSESLTFEAKEKRDRNNVAEAVAALSNTDGVLIDMSRTGWAWMRGPTVMIPALRKILPSTPFARCGTLFTSLDLAEP
jgi:hypothetical protein